MILADDRKAQRLVANRRFIDLTEISKGFYCVNMDKRSYTENSPTLIGAFILSAAKMVQLQFLLE